MSAKPKIIWWRRSRASPPARMPNGSTALELYIPREKLPATDDNEYYHADLIGLAAVTSADAPLGRVIAIHNFGAGDIIEIAPPQGATMLLPFTNAVVPTVDIAGGRVVIELPEEIEGDEPGFETTTNRRLHGRHKFTCVSSFIRHVWVV